MSKEYEMTSTMENVIIKLERAMVIFEHMSADYLQWCDKPSPYAALAWLHESSDNPMPEQKKLHGQHSAEWFESYKDIVEFMNIIGDYIHDSKGMLEKTVYSKAETSTSGSE